MLKACAAPPEGLGRPAAPLVRPGGGPRRAPAPAAAGGLLDHAGEGEPGDPRGGRAGRPLVFAHDQAIGFAAASGSLELNPFLPLVADSLLTSLELLARACRILADFCVSGISADEERCRRHVDSSTATATALLPALGYDGASGSWRPLSRAAASGRGRRRRAPLRRGVRRPHVARGGLPARLARRRHRGRRGRPMNAAPRGLRLHVGLFGRRNVGKSSLLNALTRQEVSIVSDAGTTTDPVEKPMELLPLGPVLFIDTAGVDDEGALGELRIERTRAVLDRTWPSRGRGGGWGAFEEALLAEFTARPIPLVVVLNKCDVRAPRPPSRAARSRAGRRRRDVARRRGDRRPAPGPPRGRPRPTRSTPAASSAISFRRGTSSSSSCPSTRRRRRGA